MKFLKLLIFLVFSTLSFAQNDWQRMMFDKSSNFNDIVLDFNKYYNQHVQSGNDFPKGKGDYVDQTCRCHLDTFFISNSGYAFDHLQFRSFNQTFPYLSK